MTNRAKVICDALLIDLKNDREVGREKVVAALISITRELGLSQEDFREMNQVLRSELGCSRIIWEATMVALLESIPDVSKGYAIDIARQE